MWQGELIIIEGIDGSGKGEQTKLLVARLRELGAAVTTFDFPQYGTSSAWFVERYLNGDFGTLEAIGPKTASIFYAMDRFAAKKPILTALGRGDIVICNRYVASNLAHQGSKIPDISKRQAFWRWNEELEFEINGMPQPDCNIIPLMPPDIAQRFVDQKAEREHLHGKHRDLHEADIGHLERTSAIYRELVERSPDRYFPIECAEGEKILTITEIHERIWMIVAPIAGYA